MILVYEYMNSGNLEQWLHGDMGKLNTLTWEALHKRKWLRCILLLEVLALALEVDNNMACTTIQQAYLFT